MAEELYQQEPRVFRHLVITATLSTKTTLLGKWLGKELLKIKRLIIAVLQDLKISTLTLLSTLQINITQDKEIDGCIPTTRIERQRVAKVKNYNIWIVKLTLITQLALEM